jgi:tripartite ATP-independent transporter DctP family solute receptor
MSYLSKNLALLSAGALCAFTAHAQNTIPLWNTHVDGYPVTEALKSFSADVLKLSNGRIKMEVIISQGTIGDQPKAIQLMKAGKLDIAEFNLGALSEAVPSMKAINLPFLFKDSAHMFRLLDGEMGKSFESRLFAGGYVLLAWYDGGARSFYCTNKKIVGPRDFKGLRIRVQNIEAFVDMVTLLGATPVPLPFKEVLPALEQNKIDCAENNMPSYISTGHYKVAKHVFLTDHMVSPEALVMSTSAWNAYSAEDKAMLKAAGQRSGKLMRELWNKRVIESKEIATKAGSTFERPIEFGSYLSRMKPLHQKYWKDPSTRNELATILGE